MMFARLPRLLSGRLIPAIYRRSDFSRFLSHTTDNDGKEIEQQRLELKKFIRETPCSYIIDRASRDEDDDDTDWNIWYYRSNMNREELERAYAAGKIKSHAEFEKEYYYTIEEAVDFKLGEICLMERFKVESERAYAASDKSKSHCECV